MRPQAMKYFDDISVNSLLEFDDFVASGKKIVGIYCEFSPRELIMAGDAIPICLCGYNHDMIAPAEAILPSMLCPLIKSSFGYVVTESCPFFISSEFVIAETTCDGKKKMYEILQRRKPMFVLELTQKPDEKEAFKHWYSEVQKLKGYIEDRLNVEITDDKLGNAIREMNEERKALKELQACMKADPVPMSGYDMSLVFGRVVDRKVYLANVKKLVTELQDINNQDNSSYPKGMKRILLTGCPTGLGADKVIKLTEECGAIIVCRESCTGMKSVDVLVDEGKSPLEAIAERYFKLPCSCMTPNKGRLELLDRMIGDFGVDGVIDLTWEACHTYNIESYLVAEHIKEEHGLPFLHIETDYSDSDTAQLRTRIEAFLDMLE